MTAIRLKGNSYWGKRGGACRVIQISKVETRTECFFKQKKWATNYDGNSKAKPKHYTSLLVENSRAYGFVNGKRVGKRR